MINIYKKIMNITKEQLKEFIKIMKETRGIELTEREAVKQASSLLRLAEIVCRDYPNEQKLKAKIFSDNKNK